MKTIFVIGSKKHTLKYTRKMPEGEVKKMKSFVTNKGQKLEKTSKFKILKVIEEKSARTFKINLSMLFDATRHKYGASKIAFANSLRLVLAIFSSQSSLFSGKHILRFIIETLYLLLFFEKKIFLIIKAKMPVIWGVTQLNIVKMIFCIRRRIVI